MIDLKKYCFQLDQPKATTDKIHQQIGKKKKHNILSGQYWTACFR